MGDVMSELATNGAAMVSHGTILLDSDGVCQAQRIGSISVRTARSMFDFGGKPIVGRLVEEVAPQAEPSFLPQNGSL